ncbi:hypothetical protein [Streptomyces sp. NL15-2K]
MCGSTEKVEVHHIRRLADLSKPGRRTLRPIADRAPTADCSAS